MTPENTPAIDATTPPPPPFIPGTQLQDVWDSVSLTAAMSCWRRYQYLLLEGLEPHGPSRAIALDFGIAFHSSLERYHRSRFDGQPHLDAVQSVIAALPDDPHYANLPTHTELEEEPADEDDDGIYSRNAKIRTRYHLARAVVWYLEHYEDDPATTLALESGAPAVELSFRIPAGLTIAGQPILLAGHLDRVVEFNSHLYVADYKTTKSLSRQFFADFSLSHQLSGYTLAGQSLFTRPISGAMIDGIALLIGGAKFQRAFSPRTPSQLAEYLTTVQRTLDEAERCHEEQLWPMNTSACYFCQFKELCTKPPEQRDSYKKVLFKQTRPWNPLDNR